MYIYKTEILTVGTKWLSDKADANDIAMLDKLINEKAADGWEPLLLHLERNSNELLKCSYRGNCPFLYWNCSVKSGRHRRNY